MNSSNLKHYLTTNFSLRDLPWIIRSRRSFLIGFGRPDSTVLPPHYSRCLKVYITGDLPKKQLLCRREHGSSGKFTIVRTHPEIAMGFIACIKTELSIHQLRKLTWTALVAWRICLSTSGVLTPNSYGWQTTRPVRSAAQGLERGQTTVRPRMIGGASRFLVRVALPPIRHSRHSSGTWMILFYWKNKFKEFISVVVKFIKYR